MSCMLVVSIEVDNNRIPVIKALRSATGFGLTKSIEILQEIVQNGSAEIVIPDYPDRQDKIELLLDNGFVIRASKGTPLPKKILYDNEVSVYIGNDGQKLRAIKSLRYATGLGLRETKFAIDSMYDNGEPVGIVLDSSRGHRNCVEYLIEHGFTVTGYLQECFQGEDDLFEI